MPPPQQQTAPRRSRSDRWVILCAVLLAVLLLAGSIFAVWLRVGAHVPRFTVTSLSISGGQVIFNVSDRNPNRDYGIYYTDATRASLLLHGTLVASGQALAADTWYQPSMSTASIAGTLHADDHTFFSAALRARRQGPPPSAPAARHGVLNFVFHHDRQSMDVGCDVLVGAHGSLLRESVGASCHTYVGIL